MAIAIYPGTFDPITLGHTDLVARAAKLFSKVVVAVAQNANKKPFFSFEQRIEMAKASLSNLPNIKVVGFANLLVDFAREMKASVVIRGVRAISDFDYEFQLATMNRRLHPELETVFLTPGEQFTYLSSSLVREMAIHGGDISQFVPTHVIVAFNRLLQQSK